MAQQLYLGPGRPIIEVSKSSSGGGVRPSQRLKINYFYIKRFIAPIYSFQINSSVLIRWAGQRSRYSDWLRAGRSGDRIPVKARFSAPVQTGPGVHPTSSTMGTGSFPEVKSVRVVTLTPHPLLMPWSRKSRVTPLLPLWVVRPVQSLSAYTGCSLIFTLY